MPTVLIIFGATGDLTKRKLVPALLHLSKKGALPHQFKVVGFGRRPYSDADFRAHLIDGLKEHYTDTAILEKDFFKQFVYVEGDLDTKSGYEILQNKLESFDKEWGGPSNKLFYLATSPEKYHNVFTHLAASKITEEKTAHTGWVRIIVEKPFGKDAKTAEKLDELLGTLFKEEQIYRIDHYLAKEMLQNIITFRFSNNLFEHEWNNKTIEKIEIRLFEKIGVEKRGSFYDPIGALRDVGQNHLLQMLAFITMERPVGFSTEIMREKRSEILQTLKVLDRKEIVQKTRRAQYDGYRAIDGVAKKSTTETYFQINAELSSPRFKGVPISMESGKRMGVAQKEIIVYFRHDTPCLCPRGTHYRNKVVFSIEPEERITLHFWAKKPGLSFEMEERTIEFLLRNTHEKRQYIEEYEKLLLDCITGDQMLFLSTAEVRAMWKFIDPISDAWRKNLVPLESYTPDTHEFTINPHDIELQKQHVDAPKIIGYVGLGKMGNNMVARLRAYGFTVETFDQDPNTPRTTASIEELVQKLPSPKIIWLMVPAGDPVEEVLFGKNNITTHIKKGDIVIDGGNSFYEDSIRRGKKLKKRGIHFVDVGVSGGPKGAKNGASLMIGSDKKVFDTLLPLFSVLAAPLSFARVGDTGAGHFVKMVHNGIEYGMMQAIAEGFTLLKKSNFHLSLKDIAHVYNHGTVIESRLMKWLGEGFEIFGENLNNVSGTVGHLGEGKWTVKTAKKLGISLPIIEKSFQFRVASAKKPSYTGKILSALRNRFGGHKV